MEGLDSIACHVQLPAGCLNGLKLQGEPRTDAASAKAAAARQVAHLLQLTPRPIPGRACLSCLTFYAPLCDQWLYLPHHLCQSVDGTVPSVPLYVSQEYELLILHAHVPSPCLLCFLVGSGMSAQKSEGQHPSAHGILLACQAQLRLSPSVSLATARVDVGAVHSDFLA